MQPHTGAAMTVIHHLLPGLRLEQLQFGDRSFYVRTTISSSHHGLIRQKYHSIRTTWHNLRQRELHIEVGKDYRCYMTVRHDLSFEQFDFIKHRHTYVRELFQFFKGSGEFDGHYISEKGVGHSLRGRVISPKCLVVIDTFVDAQESLLKQSLKYEFEIMSVH